MITVKCKGRGCLIRDACRRFSEPATGAQFYTIEAWSSATGCNLHIPIKVETTISYKRGHGNMNELFGAVSNDIFGEGKVYGCRWMYSPTDNDLACGILSIASNKGFDRWANSRIVEIHTVLWDKQDPDFREFVEGVVGLFS